MVVAWREFLHHKGHKGRSGKIILARRLAGWNRYRPDSFPLVLRALCVLCGGPSGLERAPARLLALDGLEEGLEIALAEAARPAALDDLEEERRPVLDGLGEDLEEVPFIVAIDEDPQLGQLV